MRNICGRWKVDADQVDEGLQTSSLKNIDHRNVELDIELLSIASEHETPVIILKFWRESELTTSTQFQFGRINSCNDSNEDVAFIRDADESFTSFKIIHYTATEIQEKEFKK